jgi:hypothetical protein
MTAINRRRCAATGSIAVGLVRELTNSTAIEGPQSIVITIRAPAEAQKLQQLCTAKACLGVSSIPGYHICDTKSLLQTGLGPATGG